MPSPSLFATVPKSDYLRFGQGDAFNPKAVTDLRSVRRCYNRTWFDRPPEGTRLNP